MDKDIKILGIKMDLGMNDRGADIGPQAIRQLGLLAELNSCFLDICDYGDLTSKVSTQLNQDNSFDIDMDNLITDFEAVAKTVAQIVGERNFPMILGGDHSISVGTIPGISKNYNNLGVIWCDAHADLNTPEITITGMIYGMALAINLGFGDSRLISIGGCNPKVEPENVVLIGTRELDPGEKEFLSGNKIEVFTPGDIHRLGIETVIKRALEQLKPRCDGIHLSFDLDVLDPEEAPGVRTPCKNGLSYSDCVTAMGILSRSQLITSAEITELNPIFDKDNKTSKVAVNLIRTLLAGQ